MELPVHRRGVRSQPRLGLSIVQSQQIQGRCESVLYRVPANGRWSGAYPEDSIMASTPLDLSQMVAELRQMSTQLAALADRLSSAAPPSTSQGMSASVVPALIQKQVMKLVRALQRPASVHDVLRVVRAHGARLDRRPIRRVLQRLVLRGLAVRRGARYQLTPDAGDSVEVMIELEEMLLRASDED